LNGSSNQDSASSPLKQRGERSKAMKGRICSGKGRWMVWRKGTSKHRFCSSPSCSEWRPKPNKKGDLHLPAVSLQVFATEPCCLLACPGPPRAVSIVPHPVRPGTAERQPQEKRTWTGRSDVTHPRPDRPTARAS